MTLAAGLARSALSPFGGVVADRYPRRAVVLWGTAALGALSAAAAALYLTANLTVALLGALGGLRGVIQAASGPALQAALPEAVPDAELLPTAVMLNATASGLARLVFPAAGGALLAIPHQGAAIVFLAVAAAYGLAGVNVARMRLRGVATPAPAGHGWRAMGRNLAEGAGEIRRHRALALALAVGLVCFTVGFPYFSLLPVVAVTNLRIGSVGLGLLYAADGAGGIAGTLVMARLRSQPAALARVQLRSGLLFVAALALLGLGSRLGWTVGTCLAVVACGASSDVLLAVNRVLLLTLSRPAQHGRVMGVAMVGQGLQPVMLLPLTGLAALTSTPTVLMGCAVVVAAGLLGTGGRLIATLAAPAAAQAEWSDGRSPAVEPGCSGLR